MKDKEWAPLISVIVPVYNGANYLRQSIDSILTQTYHNYEILVINDGSSDNGQTEQIAKSYGNKVRYFSKPNGGVATALNFGVQKMQGEYFSWLSHDDIYLPNKLLAQIEFLKGLTDRETVVFSDYECIDQNNQFICKAILDHQMLEDKPLYAVLRGAIHGCTLLIPKRHFVVCGLFDEKLCTTQDYALWFKMVQYKSFRHIPQILIQSRLHPEQGTNKISIHLQECDTLWTDFMSQISRSQILSCEKTQFLFFLLLAKHLQQSPYLAAYNHAVFKAWQTILFNPIYNCNYLFKNKSLLRRVLLNLR